MFKPSRMFAANRIACIITSVFTYFLLTACFFLPSWASPLYTNTTTPSAPLQAHHDKLYSQLGNSSSGQCPIIKSCTSTPRLDGCCSPIHGLLVLALQWEPRLSNSSYFTIHGLWPNTCTSGMTKSSGCDPTRAYRNIDQIVKLDQDLYQDMNKYWPSKFGNNSAFWEYEWGKHGTCLSTIEPRCHHDYRKYDDMMNYFRIVMSLYKQHNIYEVLKQAQITPRHDVYKRVEFEHAIKEAFGVNAVLTCKGRSLKEIRLSFYMQGYDKFILINPDMSRSTCGHHIEYRHR